MLKDLGLKTEVEYRTINPNSLDFMINVLSDILRENEVCEFNLTGGEETVLVALGIVYERFPNRVQIHKINLNTGMFLDMDGDNSHGWDGTVPGLSVENLVRIYGGSVIHSGSAQPGSEDFVWDQKFCKAVRDMWNLVPRGLRQMEHTDRQSGAGSEIRRTGKQSSGQSAEGFGSPV